MNFLLRCLLAIAVLLPLAGCTTVRLTPEAQSVRVVFSEPPAEDCAGIHEVAGSDGHWYNYLFLSNQSMVHGAFNAIRNDAARHGANTVFVSERVEGQVAAITFYGAAYTCSRQ